MPTKVNPPPGTVPPIVLAARAQTAADEQAADKRHRAHCPLCTPNPESAEHFVDALYAAHAPGYTDRTRPRMATLLSKRNPS